MSGILDNMFIQGTGGFAPNGGVLPSPPLVKFTPGYSDILNDMFIQGTGGFAPNGGILPSPPLTKSEETFVVPPLT